MTRLGSSRRRTPVTRTLPRLASVSADENVSALANVSLGLELYPRGDHEGAVAVWSRITDKNENYAMSRNNIASSLIILKRFPEARKALNQALKREPKNPLYLSNEKWLERASKTP